MILKQLSSFIILFLFAAFLSLSIFAQEPVREKLSDRWGTNARVSNERQTSSDQAPKLVPIPPPANAVCPEPAKPCYHKEKMFDDWELPFRMPARLKANKTYNSVPFYAVIVQTYQSDEDCDGGEYIESLERARRKEQKNQPTRKVFAYYSCPNMAAVGYDFKGMRSADGEEILIQNFIAVYAGETKSDGEASLNRLKKSYPKAMLKQMTANYEKIEQ
jgi:hypothetical protein